jgi:c-di-GMP phosphodiesterase
MLSKLFSFFERTPDPATPAGIASTLAMPPDASAPPHNNVDLLRSKRGHVLQREAIIGLDRRIAGYLFLLPQDDGQTAGKPDALLHHLAELHLDELLGPRLAFVELTPAAVATVAIHELPATNIVLLFRLPQQAKLGDGFRDQLAELRRTGFHIAFHRTPQAPDYRACLPHADFIVVDGARSLGDELRSCALAVHNNDRCSASLLVTGIASFDEFKFCQRLGYAYFHGAFIQHRDVWEQPACDPGTMQVMQLLNLARNEADNADLCKHIKQEPRIVYRLLRYLNSAAIGLGRPVESLDQALFVLGRDRFTRWLTLLLFGNALHPSLEDIVLAENALARGRLMEMLGARLFPEEQDMLFITGAFSLLDRLLHRPLAECLSYLALPAAVTLALIEQCGPYAPLLTLASSAEDAQAENDIPAALLSAGISEDEVSRAVIESLNWAHTVTSAWE